MSVCMSTTQAPISPFVRHPGQRRVSVVSIMVMLAIVGLPGCRKESDSTDQPSPAPSASVDPEEAINDVLTQQGSLTIIPGFEDKPFDVTLADVTAKIDPAHDKGWETETLNSTSGTQLKLLGKLFEHPADITPTQLEKLLDPDFECGTLKPTLEIAYQDPPFVVFRQAADQGKSPTIHLGAAGLAVALKELLQSLVEAKNVHVKFKTVQVEISDGSAKTGVYVEISGHTPQGIVQQNATWRCEWTISKPASPPLLKSISIEDFEEIVPNEATGPLFTDCTEAAIGAEASYGNQLIYGSDHWYGNFDVTFGIHQGNQGIAIADINGDGLEDLHVSQPSGLLNRMFQRRPDGTLKDVTVASGLDWLDSSRGALFVDLDNDGDQDLLLAQRLSITISENDGQGHFTMRKIVDTGSQIFSLAAADFDNDGDIDVYACGYTPSEAIDSGDIFANPVPYHDANNGGQNYLLRNNGNLEFEDVTSESGLSMNNHRFSFAAAWEDYDNDGDMDLYVANDFGRNNLYRNDDGQFTDVAAESGVEDVAAGMSVSWADYNHDGLMDIYVSNMFSSAGNRIAFQRNFKSDADAATLGQIQRHARGNTLFENKGDGTFRDVTLDVGVAMGRWAWGSRFVDINNDSNEDIYVANGFFTTEDTGDL